MRSFLYAANTVLFLFYSQAMLSAQQKWDAIWMIGYGTPSGDSILEHTKLDFTQNPVAITGIKHGGANFTDGANTAICNGDGVLQFYTDKCTISDWDGWPPMQGGEKLAIDKYDSLNCLTGGGYGHQSVLALPWPDSTDQYILFYYGYTVVPIAVALRPIKLYWARIDMRLNNGLGAVVETHNIVVQDTLAASYLQAVRHANGRDWWILTPEGGSNCYYTIKMTPTGPHLMFKQCTGQPWSSMQKDSQGQAVFSPDGKTYARMNWYYDLHVFDFDRCSGLLANERTAAFPDHPYETGGVAISANSRYVYTTTTTKLWQLDLQSPDLDASKILIDTYDGQPFPDYGVFYLSYLAPNNKIYIAGTSSHRHLHVINAPDSAGLACDFVQHGVPIPTFNYVSLPNYPFFRLGAADTPCDSVSSLVTAPSNTVNQAIHISPNPSAFETTLSLQNPLEGRWTLSDLSGKNMGTGIWEGASIKLSLEDLPPGLYFFQLSTKNGQVLLGKVLVLR